MNVFDQMVKQDIEARGATGRRLAGALYRNEFIRERLRPMDYSAWLTDLMDHGDINVDFVTSCEAWEEWKRLLAGGS